MKAVIDRDVAAIWPDLAEATKHLNTVAGRPTSVATMEFSGSSLLKEATYSAASETLSVIFRAGDPACRYVYFDVPREVALELFEMQENGESAGKYFTVKVKGKYTYVKRSDI